MPLVFDHVTYRYGDEIGGPALNDVCLTVADGEFVAVIGHTGSGKSTLAEHCNATKVPTQGAVTVDGIPTSDRRRRREVRRLVGFAAQYPEYQLFAETVREDVAFGPRNLGLSPQEAQAAAREAIELVGLDYDAVAEASPFDLSGGQKRRAALAGIVAMRPKFLVLDEPMVGLDPRGRREVLDIVRRLHDGGTGILMVSHSMDDVAQLAQKVIVLDRGSVLDQGAPAEVFARAGLLRDVGLDVPKPAAFAEELAARGWNLPGPEPLTVDALADAIVEALARQAAGGARGAAPGEAGA